MKPTFGSLFAGVGGFDLGLERAGWTCGFQVEWDTNCQAVLARHWPDVPRWGDVSDVDGATLPPVDLITFGSPCQDLSVAGKRAGLDGARSGLFFEAIRIIQEMRDATDSRFPRFVIWENVAGALTSSGGADFGAVLDALEECGALDIAWRVLDARHFGVPQRRRRVFVVCDLGGECAGAIHAESSSLPWHPRSLGQDRSRYACGVAAGVGAGNGKPVIVFGWQEARYAGKVWLDETPTLTTTKSLAVMQNGLRRLSPLECERLMAFPDDHTRWRADGTEQSDSARYRQCGNGVVANVAEWIGRHILNAMETTK